LLNYQNNYVERSNFKQVASLSKFFAALLITFKVSTKLFSDLYPTKF